MKSALNDVDDFQALQLGKDLSSFLLPLLPRGQKLSKLKVFSTFT